MKDILRYKRGLEKKEKSKRKKKKEKIMRRISKLAKRRRRPKLWLQKHLNRRNYDSWQSMRLSSRVIKRYLLRKVNRDHLVELT